MFLHLGHSSKLYFDLKWEGSGSQTQQQPLFCGPQARMRSLGLCPCEYYFRPNERNKIKILLRF